jgi:hypothetical protein
MHQQQEKMVVIALLMFAGIVHILGWDTSIAESMWVHLDPPASSPITAPPLSTIPCSLDSTGLATATQNNCQVDGYVGSTIIFEDESVS